MKNAANYHVFVLLDADAKPVYIGMGKAVKRRHPAENVWCNRLRDNSPLGNWLNSLSEPPQRGRVIGDPGSGVTAHAAHELFTLNRRALLESGAILLSHRSESTYVSGGGHRRRVQWGNEGLEFESVREAARFVGVHVSTIIRRLQANKDGWRYVED